MGSPEFRPRFFEDFQSPRHIGTHPQIAQMAEMPLGAPQEAEPRLDFRRDIRLRNFIGPPARCSRARRVFELRQRAFSKPVVISCDFHPRIGRLLRFKII